MDNYDYISSGQMSDRGSGFSAYDGDDTDSDINSHKTKPFWLQQQNPNSAI